MWVGTWRPLARAYEAAACLLHSANTGTNFSSFSADSPTSPRLPRPQPPQPQEREKKQSAYQYQYQSSWLFLSAQIQLLRRLRFILPRINFNPHSPTSTPIESKICSSSSSSSNTSGGAPCHERKQKDGMLGEELDLVWPSLAPLLQENSSPAASEETAELERVKVERQFSALLHAMNGVQLDPLPLETLWDLPVIFPTESVQNLTELTFK